ncbi:MAG: DNA mismatch endonuclease Vsr [Flavobacteriaceae bacterium]|nr:DNA mismatch endonuclease Vsr [Flavobacteriaceae bacterium]
MADVHSKVIRSKNMSAIRDADTKPELAVRRSLHAMGFRFRLHCKKLLGTPDIVLPRYKVVIFVNGCFWHKHDCEVFRLPATRTDWWNRKLTANRLRDEAVQDKLRESGWRVMVIWECGLKGRNRILSEERNSFISRWVREAGSSYVEIPAPMNLLRNKS